MAKAAPTLARRAFLGAALSAPVAVAAPRAIPAPANDGVVLPTLKPGFVWVPVRETVWAAMLDAARSLADAS